MADSGRFPACLQILAFAHSGLLEDAQSFMHHAGPAMMAPTMMGMGAQLPHEHVMGYRHGSYY